MCTDAFGNQNFRLDQEVFVQNSLYLLVRMMDREIHLGCMERVEG